MSLRRQLLIVSLLLLSLPWAGCQFIREMEGALRTGQEQSLQATAGAIAAVLGQRQELLYPVTERRLGATDRGSSLYAVSAPGPIIVDGYGDAWDAVDAVTFRGGSEQSRLSISARAQTRGDYLYLLFRVQDPQVVYHNPGLSGEPNGDRLTLRLWQGGKRQDYVISTAAPGSVRAKFADRRHRGIDPGRIRGYWQDAVGGYTLELEVPMSYTGGRAGFFLVDEDRRSGNDKTIVGNMRRLDMSPPPWLIYSPEALRQTLSAFSNSSARTFVIDRGHWEIADLPGAAANSQSPGNTFWLLRLLYRAILYQEDLPEPAAAPRFGKKRGEEINLALAGNSANLRYRDPDDNSRTILSAAAPIRDADGVLGVVLLRQSGETYLSLTDQAFSRLVGYSLLAIAAGALGLLAYASVLSWRIRRLSRAASGAISEDGRVTGSFPRSNAADEIGELSRHYADLLGRLREYNDYLHSLSRKLSHELRTPIAVIQSSLDNLEHEGNTPPDQTVYLERSREGLKRLQHILTAMSEASRLEESIRGQEVTELDLVPLLKAVFDAYRGVYSDHELTLSIQPGSALIKGVPELIVQGLDKLMDNAASFCPEGGSIELQLTAVTGGFGFRLRLSNQGPALPDGAAERMFEPMVSLREGGGADVHLGLGLHIVRLVVEFHSGTIWAENLEDGAGVAMIIDLPVSAN